MYKHIVASFACMLYAACSSYSQKVDYINISGTAQGSTYHITYENTVNKNLKPDFESMLMEIDNSLSIYNANSIISRINRNDTSVRLNSILTDNIKLSFQVWKESKGYYDITVGPLVRNWGFGPNSAHKPKNENIDSLLKLVGMNKIQIKNNSIIKVFPQMQIDLNAIAQGYTVDYLSKYLDSLKIQNYLVEVGGEVIAKGRNAKGKIWHVGIDKPSDTSQFPGQELQAVIELEDMALATSGNYRKFYIENGVKYSHTIDPFTGFPSKNNLLSVTIINANCALADAYATACMAMGLEKAIDFVKNTNLKAYFVFSSKNGEIGEFRTEDFK